MSCFFLLYFETKAVRMLRHLVFKNQLGNYRIALGFLSFVVAVHKRSLILFYQGFLFRTSSLTSSLCKKKKKNKTKRFLKSRQVYQKILKISNNSTFFFVTLNLMSQPLEEVAPENRLTLAVWTPVRKKGLGIGAKKGLRSTAVLTKLDH